MKKKFSRFVFWMIALALAGCGSQPPATPAAPTSLPSGTVIAEGHIRPMRSVNLAFQAGGGVAEIMVKTGEAVRKGEALMKLDSYEAAQAQLTSAQLELTSAQQAFDALNRDATGSQAQLWEAYMNAQVVRENAQKTWDGLNLHDIEIHIRDAQDTLATRQGELTDAQAGFDQVRNLDPNSGRYKVAQDRLRNKQKAYDEAVTNLESDLRARDDPQAALNAALSAEAEAKYQYDLTSQGPNTDQLALAQARLDNARAQAAAAEQALGNYELSAPFDGVVADVSVDLGQQVGPQQVAVSVVDPSQWIVETNDLTELEVVRLAVGQKVAMVPDALPALRLSGTVQTISGAFTKQGGDIVYAVRILVDNPVDPRIRWGMTVEATFAPLSK
ncbi:MAG TPA: HlyD family efflux transporter periplasmic adaptor subunit [Anaerolineales bacterium]|nr:HlyD family efflux transporter periplasmic adaptor subunit [Anaerolineales bacterium]